MMPVRLRPLSVVAGERVRRRGAGGRRQAPVAEDRAAADHGAGGDNLPRVAELVRSTGADIVLLQEVDRGTNRSGHVDQPAVLARLTGFTASFGKSLDYDGGLYGIAVLSRWPVARDTVVDLPV